MGGMGVLVRAGRGGRAPLLAFGGQSFDVESILCRAESFVFGREELSHCRSAADPRLLGGPLLLAFCVRHAGPGEGGRRPARRSCRRETASVRAAPPPCSSRPHRHALSTTPQ